MKKKSRLFKVVLGFSIFMGIIFSFGIFGYCQGKYPTRPITFIIPYPAGGNTDLASRLLAKEAEKYLGQPIVPINKTGAAVGTAAITTAKPDGYTIGFGGHSLFLTPLLENVPYHPIKDIRYVMQFGSFNFGTIVKADSPFKTFKELIAYARENPKKLSYGTGPNTTAYFNMVQIALKENVQFIFIPYKGGPEMQTALLGGHISFGLGDFNYSLLEAKQVRLLLLLKEEKSSEYPDAPVLKDLGYGDVPAPLMCSVIGPKGLPDEIVKRLEDAFTKAMKDPGFINGMKELRTPIVYRNSKDLNAYAAYNYESYSKLLKDMGVIK
jgi:tripartite-type tricarboxylate transporter receptor subunit TctC